jgi:delta-aminolevulinic acid dehydratase/porphobilinogen synthase
MMDGRVGAIRAALDAEGFHDVSIMSYTAKYIYLESSLSPYSDAHISHFAAVWIDVKYMFLQVRQLILWPIPRSSGFKPTIWG